MIDKKLLKLLGNNKKYIFITVCLMIIGFVLMIIKSLYIPCGILAGVWLFHIIYFIFFVKTMTKEEAEKMRIENDKEKSEITQ